MLPALYAAAIVEPWHWLAFGAFVVVVLTLDLTVFHRKSKETSLREAAGWTVVWCSMALLFNALLWKWLGPKPALEFLTGYLIEWSLSMDNVFVFAVIFSFFRVPLKYQYRVLFWGILGAIIMRLTFILIGSELIHRFDWVMPLFGAFLIYTGIKLVMHDDEQVDPGNNLLMRLARKIFPVASGEHGNKFFVREAGKLCITRLFLVLLVVESTDVLFAVDSVPAIFGITKDPFIVFTSNIFAILGLRALYFLLAGVMDMFRYLKYGLSAVLIFVGLKMVADYASHVPAIADFLGFGPKAGEHLISPGVSLIIVLSLLGISIAASIWAKAREDRLGIKTDAAPLVTAVPNADAAIPEAEPVDKASMPTVAILGASADRTKFGNKSVRAHLKQGYTVYPVNPKGGEVEGLKVYPRLADLPGGRLNRISVYLPPPVLLNTLEEIAARGCDELFLNPGTESEAVLAKARELGLDPIQACSIVDLGFKPEDV